jgi:hypothetical protein
LYRNILLKAIDEKRLREEGYCMGGRVSAGALASVCRHARKAGSCLRGLFANQIFIQ